MMGSYCCKESTTTWKSYSNPPRLLWQQQLMQLSIKNVCYYSSDLLVCHYSSDLVLKLIMMYCSMMYLTSDIVFVVLYFYVTNLSSEEENPCNMYVLSYKVLYYVPYEAYELSSVINACIWTLRYVQDMNMQVSLNHGKVQAIGIDVFSCWAQNY